MIFGSYLLGPLGESYLWIWMFLFILSIWPVYRREQDIHVICYYGVGTLYSNSILLFMKFGTAENGAYMFMIGEYSCLIIPLIIFKKRLSFLINFNFKPILSDIRMVTIAYSLVLFVRNFLCFIQSQCLSFKVRWVTSRQRRMILYHVLWYIEVVCFVWLCYSIWYLKFLLGDVYWLVSL